MLLDALEPPLRLSAYAWEAQPGRLSMTVSCELTLKLTHGAEARFVEPSPSFDEAMVHLAEADFRAPFKPRTDVLCTGHAYAPADDAEVDRLLVRLRIGEWSKAVRVTGDRFWLRESGRLVPGPARKFRRIMLSGERAARSPENPQGIDLEAVPVEHRIALPNLEPASVGYSGLLGPVPQNAPSRSGLIHPVAHGWIHALLSGHRAGPPHDGFNFAYFNLAPFDQQVPEIPIGAAIVLENLHPEHAVFTSRIPSVRPRAFVFDPQALQQLEIPLRCDTLWIDADRETATLVFRGVIPISHPDLASQVILKVESVERSAPTPAPHMSETQVGTDLVAHGLPFTKAQNRAGPTPVEPPVAPGPSVHRPTVKLSSPPLPGGGFVTQEISVGAGLGALPFDGRPPHHEDETTQSLGDDPTTATNEGALEPRGRLPSSVPPDDPTPRPFQAPPATLPNPPSVTLPNPPPATLPNPALEATREGPRLGPPGAAAYSRVSIKLVPPDIGPTPAPPLPPRPTSASEPAPVSRTLPGVPPKKTGLAMPQPASVATAAAPMQFLPMRPPPSPQLGALQLGTGKLASLQLRPDKRPESPTDVAISSGAAATETTAQFKEASASAPKKGGSPSNTPAPFENAPTPPDPSMPGEAASADEPPTLARDATAALVPIKQKSDNEPTLGEEVTDHSTSDRKGIEARTLEEADADADRDAFEFPLPPSDGFEVDGVTLDHCAAIRAAIAMPNADRAAVLRKHQLDEASFARIEKTHLGRIDQETSNGAQDLLNRYDAAYVAAQDGLRRPIGVKEYARIVVARQEGDIADVMADLGVPRSELMRIDRVWKRRVAEYPEVDKTLKALVESPAKKR